MFPVMRKRFIFRDRFRKPDVEIRNRLLVVTTCLAIIALVHYTKSPGPSIESTLKQEYSSSDPVVVVESQNLLGLQHKQFDSEATSFGSLGRLRRTQGDGDDTTKAPPLEDIQNCKDRNVYIHRVPQEWNAQILADCHLLKEWTDMCIALSNAGLGPPLRDHNAEESEKFSGWYETQQFALEVIFHNRMMQYDCITGDSTQASAIYVPFYAGLEAQRTLWGDDIATRDANPRKFELWLLSQPEWEAHNGHDHFMVGGRITWDFRRKGDSGWGNNLLTLPAIQNMTTLVIESSPWDPIDIAIPYPTNFHPSTDTEIRNWQAKILTSERPVLFSFAGGTRTDMSKMIRGELIDQCRRSPHCKLLSCDGGACESPRPLMTLFEESQFCLQPQGDSPTRKSIFDSMISGCIPVFFHTDSYSGYAWHLPKNQSEYSVFIPEEHIRSGVLSVESVLRRIPATTIRHMRETIVELIPSLVYANPRGVSTIEDSNDAFGIALKGVLNRISEKKRNLQQQTF